MAFQPSDSDGNVPAFLKGQDDTIYRATGPSDVYTETANEMSFLRSGKSLDFPLPLASEEKFDDPWGSNLMANLYSDNPKKLEAGLGYRPNLEDQFDDLALEPASCGYFSSDDEREEISEEQHFMNFPTLTLSCGSGDISEILSNVCGAFDQNVHFDAQVHLARAKGVILGAHDRCEFQLQVVTAGSQHKAEFQHRCGSRALFSQFFTATSSAVSRNGFFDEVIISNPIADAAGTMSAQSCVQPQVEEVKEALDEDTCVQLVDMCLSEFADVQRDALATVSTLDAEQIHPAVYPQMMQVFVSSSASTDASVRWNGARLLAKMCTLPEFGLQALVLLQTLFDLLKLSDCVENKDTKLQAARALHSVVSHNGSERILDSEYEGTIENLEALAGSSDDALQFAVGAIIDLLVA